MWTFEGREGWRGTVHRISRKISQASTEKEGAKSPGIGSKVLIVRALGILELEEMWVPGKNGVHPGLKNDKICIDKAVFLFFCSLTRHPFLYSFLFFPVRTYLLVFFPQYSWSKNPPEHLKLWHLSLFISPYFHWWLFGSCTGIKGSKESDL